MTDDSTRRLVDLLENPRETLDIELKGWLALANNNNHKALLAKAIIALANHGGGVVIIGFEETPDGVVPAGGRPDDLAMYTPDIINSIVTRYAEPSFHCDVQIVTSPADNLDYSIVVIPGGHHFPVRSKREAPNGNSINLNMYYIRRPGPKSEPPQSGQEWDKLLRRCISNNRDELLDSFRLLMEGGLPGVPAAEAEGEQVLRSFNSSMQRWQELIATLQAPHGAQMQHGHYAIGYKLFDDELVSRNGAALLDTLKAGEIRLTGWPPFLIPGRKDIDPYIQDGNVELWLGRDEHDHGPGHSDFWQVSPNAQFFLLRGYQEDDKGNDRAQPGQVFDITLPTWRVGEVLLHAASMARQFEVPDARIIFNVEWTGLSGRSLTSWANPHRLFFGDYTARQDVFRVSITTLASSINDTLPETSIRDNSSAV